MISEKSAKRLWQHIGLLIEQSRFAEAEHKLLEILVLQPEDPDMLYWLAYCRFNLPARETEALATIKQAITIQPDNAEFLAMMAHILAKQGEIIDAWQIAEEAINLQPDAALSYYALASVFFQGNDFAMAAQYLRQALQVEPDDPDSKKLLAECLRMQSKHAAAGEVADSLDSESMDANFLLHKGNMALDSGNFSEAEILFKEVLRQKPDSKFARYRLIEARRATFKPYGFALKIIARLRGNMLATIAALGLFLVVFGFAGIVAVLVASLVLHKLGVPDLQHDGIIFRLIVVLILLLVISVIWVSIMEIMADLFLLVRPADRKFLHIEEYVRIIVFSAIFFVSTGLVISGLAYMSLALLTPVLYLIFSGYSFSYCFYNRSRLGQIAFAIIGCALCFFGLYHAMHLNFSHGFGALIAALICGYLLQMLARWDKTNIPLNE